MSLFAELKRRKVIRVAVVYVATAFAVIQAADVMLPRLGVPDWTVTLVVVLTLLGFPIALVLAWALDLTPDGLRVTAAWPVDAVPVPPVVGKRTVATAAALLLVGVGLGAGWFLKPLTHAPQDAGSRPASVPAVPAALVAEAGGEKSIAVLPFVNMSGDSENEYFADGISEEILNLLAKVRSLRVAGRTSAFKFKGHNEDLRLIGEQLGVNHILEGSVRKSGNRVRITAQLVKAGDGFHLWSDTYDRELTDIFAVQDEIGGAIVAALRVQLESGPTPHVAVAQLDTYTHYLRAQTLLATRGAANLRAAREQFEAALAIEPDYVPALAGLAKTLSLLPAYARAASEPPAEVAEVAIVAANRVLAFEPDNVMALSALGTVYTYYLWRWDEAEAAFARALELAPNDAEVVNLAGDFYVATMNARAIMIERRAVELDPLHAVNYWDLGWAYMADGDCDAAVVAAESARGMAPDRINSYVILNWCLGQLGRFDDQRRITGAARRQTSGSESYLLVMEARLAMAEDRRDDAMAIQATLRADVEAGAHEAANLGYHYLLLGESGQAAVWLQRAYDQRSPDLIFPGPIDLQRLAADPYTRALLEQPGLKELVDIRARNARAAGEPR